jgi:hypothetical protein
MLYSVIQRKHHEGDRRGRIWKDHTSQDSVDILLALIVRHVGFCLTYSSGFDMNREYGHINELRSSDAGTRFRCW